MNTDSQLIAEMAAKCKRVLQEWDQYDARLPNALQKEHLLGMCHTIEEHSEVVPVTKAHRWIGFIQAAILAHGMLDLRELKAMFAEAKRAHAVARDDLDNLTDHLDPADPFELDLGGQG